MTLASATPSQVQSAIPAPSAPGPENPARAGATPEKPTPEKSTAPPSAGAPSSKAGLAALSEADRAWLKELLTHAAAADAKPRSNERSPEQQVAVMLRLAQQDLDKAKAMYCAAGDRVLERFEPKASAEKNASVMLETLIAVLPEARAAGCLNHIRNKDVVSVDIKLDDIPEARRDSLVKAAEAGVSAGKIVRFLAPPREPDAFHFEFKRRSE